MKKLIILTGKKLVWLTIIFCIAITISLLAGQAVGIITGILMSAIVIKIA